MKTDNIHMITYKWTLFFCMVFSIVSCTLYMDDEPLREDLRGFDEVVKEMTAFGEVEYQYKDSVYSLASNVLEYVQRIEHDSIIYYLESTPEEFIPKPGYYLSAQCSRRIPFGLNSMVIKVERTGGMIKVTTTHAPIEKVYKHLNADFTFPVNFQSITGKDSLQMAELGIDTTDLALTDWTLFNKSMNEDDADNAEAKTRGGSDDPWHTLFDGGFDTNNVGDGVFDLYFDSNSGSGILSGDLVQAIETYLTHQPAGEYFKHVHVAGGVKLELNSQMHVKMCLDPLLEITIDFHSAPTVEALFEMGFGTAPSYDLIKKTQLFRRNRCKDFFKRNSIKMPKIKFPLPFLSPATVGVITPRLSFGFSVWGMGRFNQKFYLDEIKCHLKYENQFLTENYCETSPSKHSERPVLSGMLSAQASLTGGIGIGISTAGDAVNVLINNDIQNTFSGSVEESTPTLMSVDYSAYDPNENRIGFNMDYVLSADATLSIPTLSSVVDEFSPEDMPEILNFFQDYTISKELHRGTLLKKYFYIRPGVGDFSVISKQYNPEDEKLKNFTVRLSILDDGFLDNYKKNGAQPFIAIKGMSKKFFTYLDKDSKGNTYSGIEKRNYDFYYEPDKYRIDPDGYSIVPCIKTADGDTVQINGWEIHLPADLKMVSFLQPDFTQSFGLPVKDLKGVKKLLVNNKYKNNSAYAANPEKFSFYEFMVSHKLVGAANVLKWGLDVTIKEKSSGAKISRELIVEDRSKKAFKSGVKNVLLSFISDDDFSKYAENEAPYTVTVEPFYYTTTNTRKKVNTGVVTTQTLVYNMKWDDAFTDMDFISIGM